MYYPHLYITSVITPLQKPCHLIHIAMTFENLSGACVISRWISRSKVCMRHFPPFPWWTADASHSPWRSVCEGSHITPAFSGAVLPAHVPRDCWYLGSNLKCVWIIATAVQQNNGGEEEVVETTVYPEMDATGHTFYSDPLPTAGAR